MPAESLNDAALFLYGLPVDEFVEARNTLEKDVRKAGDRELAAQIKALRKPSVVAAGLNAMVRADPEAVDELLTAVDDLRDAQEQITSGGQSDLGTLQRGYRQAIHALVDLADESRRLETQAALEAAAVEPALHELLRTGTFAAAPQPTGSFGIALASTGAVTGAKQPTRKRKPAPAPAARPMPRPNLRLVRAARTKAEAAKDRKTAAERFLAAAQETVHGLDERIRTLEADLIKAEADRAETQEAVIAAAKELAASIDEVAKAEAALEQTEST